MRWIFVLLCFLTSCSSTQSPAERARKQRLSLCMMGEPPTLDPRKAIDTASLNVLKFCFEGLIEIDDAGNLIPALAERVEHSEDHTRYTFYLRESVWSDGTPVTAHDVEDTWKTLLSPTFPCPFASELYVLKHAKAAKQGECGLAEVGVHVLDERTLVVELERPIPYMLALLASSSFPIVPSHIVHTFPKWADRFGPQFVSNGPFLLTSWRHNAEITLKKNEQYWNAEKIRLSAISMAMIEDENTSLSLFENGQLDWVGNPLSSLPLDAIESLKQKKEIAIHPIAGIYYYLFNTKQYPFTNMHIRRALSFALNRHLLIENVLQTDQLPAMALIPPSMWKQEGGIFSDADAELAREELALGLKELGISKKELPAIELTYNTNNAHHKIAQAIQGQWLDVLGISVVLSSREWKVFLDELRHYQFSIARMGGMAGYNDPMTFFELYKYLGNSDNYTQWSHPEFTSLLDQSDRAADPEKRVEILKQAEKLLISEMPILPIYFYTGSYLKNQALQGIRIDALGAVDFRYAYLETPP